MSALHDTMIEPPNYAYGWYAPLIAHEVTDKKITGFDYMGQRLIAFRNKEGKVIVLDSVCPHFGADLSKGDLCDGQVRCYFHGFYFDDEGQCTKGDVVKDPTTLEKISVPKYAVEECAGQIWVWHGPNMSVPDIELPIKSLNWAEWSLPVTSPRRTIADSNMCFQTENIIDMQHFDTVHKWKLHELVDGPRVDEEGRFITDIKVTINPGAQSEKAWVRKLTKHINMNARICFKVYSPGNAIATSYRGSEIDEENAQRNVVCIYPIDENNVSIRVACIVRIASPTTALNRFKNTLRRPMDFVVGKIMAAIAVSDFDGDLKVWNNRKYLTNPKYVKEDGPMILFRKWYLRFWHEDYLHELSNPATTGKKRERIKMAQA
jgi:phenylpropionate dioxygenase-like ring-hydroxylating dioxygenase large terminal subunit